MIFQLAHIATVNSGIEMWKHETKKFKWTLSRMRHLPALIWLWRCSDDFVMKHSSTLMSQSFHGNVTLNRCLHSQ